MSKYIWNRWCCSTSGAEYDKLKQHVKRCIDIFKIETRSGDALQKPGKGIVQDGHRCRVVNPKERVRFASRTRQWSNTKMPELQHELFQWWVDLSQTLQARVPTCLIMAEAKNMLKDARCAAEDRARELGLPTPAYREPKIGCMWISRWRRFFSIVPRCITCCYKVAYWKRERRMGVLWRNACRLLVLHECLYGPDKLTFVSLDEKPNRFNACGGDKVYAIRGQKAVKCKELRAMLLKY